LERSGQKVYFGEMMDIENRKKELTDLEREVTQNKGTEAPFTGELLRHR
jgi:peptide methionine sulfoxide reductase MsrB